MSTSQASQQQSEAAATHSSAPCAVLTVSPLPGFLAQVPQPPGQVYPSQQPRLRLSRYVPTDVCVVCSVMLLHHCSGLLWVCSTWSCWWCGWRVEAKPRGSPNGSQEPSAFSNTPTSNRHVLLCDVTVCGCGCGCGECIMCSPMRLCLLKHMHLLVVRLVCRSQSAWAPYDGSQESSA